MKIFSKNISQHILLWLTVCLPLLLLLLRIIIAVGIVVPIIVKFIIVVEKSIEGAARGKRETTGREHNLQCSRPWAGQGACEAQAAETKALPAKGFLDKQR